MDESCVTNKADYSVVNLFTTAVLYFVRFNAFEVVDNENAYIILENYDNSWGILGVRLVKI